MAMLEHLFSDAQAVMPTLLCKLDYCLERHNSGLMSKKMAVSQFYLFGTNPQQQLLHVAGIY